MPKRKHVHITSGKRKRDLQAHITATSHGNDMIRQFRIASGHSGLRLHRRRHAVPHFSIGSTSTTMEVDSGTNGSGKRARHDHEARLVPGLGALEWGFPNSIIVPMRYCVNRTLTSTTGATGSKVYRANGIYAPEYTDSGHQPMFSDQWGAIYNFYTVLGAKIRVTLKGTSTYSTVVCLQGSSTPTLSSGVNTFLEQNNGVHTIVGNTYCEPQTMEITYSPLENTGQEVKNDGSSMTAVGADPSAGEGTYYFGLLYNTSDAASTSTMDIIVEIEYTVKYSELTKNGGS